MQNVECLGGERWEKLLWYSAFLLLAFLVGCVQVEDPDIWWHLRTGQLIYQRGTVPSSDWFTYTNPESPWIDLHWGFQLMAAGLWAIGGVAALVLTKSLFAAATFLLGMLAVRREWPAWQTVACWLPALLIFSARNQVRPEMFSLLFLAAELAILFQARTRPGLLWLLPAIQVLWINVHGLFVLGLVLWASFVISEAFSAVLRSAKERSFAERKATPNVLSRSERRQSVVSLRRLMIVSALMAAAALANPYGLNGAFFPLTLLQRIEGEEHAFYSFFSGEFLSIPELLSLNGLAPLLRDSTPGLLLLSFLLGGLSFVPHAARWRLDLFRLAIFLLFGWLAWKANRNWVLFALVSGAVLRANVGEWLASHSLGPDDSPARSRLREKSGRRRKFRPEFSRILLPPLRSELALHAGRVLTAAALGILLIGVPLDMLSVTRLAEIPRWFGVGEVAGAFPHAAAEFLGQPGMPRRCYAIDEGAAAVYIFHNGPDRKVFADARLEVNTRSTLERYLAIEGQIVAGDSGVLDSLKEGIPPDADGRIELPALLISLPYLARNRPLQQGLLRLSAYRRVFVDDNAVAFIEQQQADALGLPELGR